MTDLYTTLHDGLNTLRRTSRSAEGRPDECVYHARLAFAGGLDGEAEALVRKVVQLALEGDLTCLRICIERLVPPKKDAPIEVDIPEVSSIADIPKLFSALTAKIRAGVTPSEARTVMDLAEGVHKTLAIAELEQRYTAMEEKMRLMNR